MFGGGERGLGQLATGVNRDRFRTHLAAHPGGRLEAIARTHEIPFFPLDMSSRFNFKTISKLISVIRQERIHIVHSMGSRSDFFARIAGRRSSVPAMVSTMAMLVEGYDIGSVQRFIYRVVDGFTEKWTDQFIAVSKSVERSLIRHHGLTEDKLRTIYNGVELSRYSHEKQPDLALKSEFGFEGNTRVVGIIGRFVYQKGYRTFLEAASIIAKSWPDVRFLLVGDGPLKADIVKRMEDLKLSGQTVLTGERNDIPELLSIMDIVAQPSILEGLPRVIIEAMAMAKPIVASDIDGIREEIDHGKTGILVPSKDPNALAEAIMMLLKDETKARGLGMAARKAADQRFNLNRQIALYEAMYLELLSKKGVKPSSCGGVRS